MNNHARQGVRWSYRLMLRCSIKEKLDDHPAKVLRHPLKITERDVYEPAVLIEAALQHDAVVMRIPPQKLAASLIGQDHPGHDALLSRLVVKTLNDGKDQSADFREQTAGWAPPCDGSRAAGAWGTSMRSEN